MSPPLAKAILLALDEVKGTGKDPTPTFKPQPNGAFEVQFNPTSLKITRQNNIDQGPATTKGQSRQNPSAQSATLAFDLEFDTAEIDDGSGGPVDVRTKTRIVRQFAEPTKEKPTAPPPPVRFIWGTFSFTGLVTQVTEDLDYFSSDGRPLRAKVSVTITEKNPDLEAKLVGAALRTQSGATPAGSGQGTGPGSKPAGNADTTARANDGESLQQLLSRLNADPATWRAAMAGLDSPIGLAAGAQVQLAAGVSAGAGLGGSAGFALGASASASATLGAALGMSAGAGASASFGAAAGGGFGVSAGAGLQVAADASGSAGFTAGGGVAVDAEAAAGFSLAEGGGVVASYALVAAADAQASVAVARSAFAVPAAPLPQVTAGASIGSAAVGGLAARAPVELDPRAQGYGAGIPLRARAHAVTVVETSVGGAGAVSARASIGEVAVTTSGTVPSWRQLVAGDPGGQRPTPSNGAVTAATARCGGHQGGDCVTVHVDEIHTDVVPSGGSTTEEPAKPTPHLGAGLEAWREASAECVRLTARTAAHGFDD